MTSWQFVDKIYNFLDRIVINDFALIIYSNCTHTFITHTNTGHLGTWCIMRYSIYNKLHTTQIIILLNYIFTYVIAPHHHQLNKSHFPRSRLLWQQLYFSPRTLSSNNLTVKFFRYKKLDVVPFDKGVVKLSPECTS